MFVVMSHAYGTVTCTNMHIISHNIYVPIVILTALGLCQSLLVVRLCLCVLLSVVRPFPVPVPSVVSPV